MRPDWPRRLWIYSQRTFLAKPRLLGSSGID
jgi:hypothetical protein